MFASGDVPNLILALVVCLRGASTSKRPASVRLMELHRIDRAPRHWIPFFIEDASAHGSAGSERQRDVPLVIVACERDAKRLSGFDPKLRCPIVFALGLNNVLAFPQLPESIMPGCVCDRVEACPAPEHDGSFLNRPARDGIDYSPFDRGLALWWRLPRLYLHLSAETHGRGGKREEADG